MLSFVQSTQVFGRISQSLKRGYIGNRAVDSNFSDFLFQLMV